MQTPFSFMRRALILCLLFLSSPLAAAATDQPNVILITLDTVRADRMGFLGSKLGLTPHLDALASQGIVFEHAYSQAPITPVSHATILTGTYPQFHGIRVSPQVYSLVSEVDRFAEAMLTAATKGIA